MTLRILYILIQLILLFYFPTSSTQIFQCVNKTAITEDFKLGPIFGNNYCLAYGEILNAAIDAADTDEDDFIDDNDYSDNLCRCVSTGSKCENRSYDQPCSGGQTYCCDDFEFIDQQDDGNCWSRIIDDVTKIQPWHVTLKSYSYRKKKFEAKCDAVIIHPLVILTDSSCYSGKEKLFIADSDQKRGMELIREKKVYKYLALVRLKTALNFTKTIRSLCLPFAPINLNKPCTLITSSGIEILPEISNTTVCLNGLSNKDQKEGKHLHTICITSQSKRKCQVDSKTRIRGAPLFCELAGRKGEFAVAGIVPNMFRCDGFQPLEYFSDLQAALDWISQTFIEWGIDVSSFTP